MKGIVIDETKSVANALESTAIDDYTIRNASDQEMVLHMFQHEGINMGYDDLHLENFNHGLKYLKANDERVIIRSSGGRSIVADEGVLNLSLIFKSEMSMDENYEYFSDFIKSALRPLVKEIDVKEIKGACCPGKTDMSINGKKFCGTAQRRVKDTTALVCYISINGDQDRRNKLVKGFYDACETDDVFIDENTMDSLSNLLQKEISVQEVVRLFEKEFSRHTSVMSYQSDIKTKDGYKQALEITMKRNKDVINI